MEVISGLLLSFAGESPGIHEFGKEVVARNQGKGMAGSGSPAVVTGRESCRLTDFGIALRDSEVAPS